jgi:hypothetical protein
MSAGLYRFTAGYASAFRRHQEAGEEGTLRAAYELGREAVRHGLSVLDLALVHHDVLARALDAEPEPGEIERRTRAAGEFFIESLSAFEMVQRGYREARDAALLERQQAEMLRQLSHFLADASLALGAPGSLEEILRLVAEEARELVGAEVCLARVATDREGTLSVASAAEPEGGWVELLESAGLDREPPGSGPRRLGRLELARHPAVVGAAPSPVDPSGWLYAPLTALDGRQVGSIQLLDKREGEFNAVDEAMLVHLAQMASAAIERRTVYGRPR